MRVKKHINKQNENYFCSSWELQTLSCTQSDQIISDTPQFTSDVEIDHRPSIGRIPNLSGRSLVIVPEPDIKMWRAANPGYLTMGHLWNPSFNWWQIDHGPDKNLRTAEYWPKVNFGDVPEWKELKQENNGDKNLWWSTHRVYLN